MNTVENNRIILLIISVLTIYIDWLSWFIKRLNHIWEDLAKKIENCTNFIIPLIKFALISHLGLNELSIYIKLSLGDSLILYLWNRFFALDIIWFCEIFFHLCAVISLLTPIPFDITYRYPLIANMNRMCFVNWTSELIL